VVTLVIMESSLKYRPSEFEYLTSSRHPAERQCLVGSLTGVVASQNVTEAFKGSLMAYRNRHNERKSIRELDCEAYKPSRCESRI
jgi:sRNA-binding protein